MEESEGLWVARGCRSMQKVEKGNLLIVESIEGCGDPCGLCIQGPSPWKMILAFTGPFFGNPTQIASLPLSLGMRASCICSPYIHWKSIYKFYGTDTKKIPRSFLETSAILLHPFPLPCLQMHKAHRLISWDFLHWHLIRIVNGCFPSKIKRKHDGNIQI